MESSEAVVVIHPGPDSRVSPTLTRDETELALAQSIRAKEGELCPLR